MLLYISLNGQDFDSDIYEFAPTSCSYREIGATQDFILFDYAREICQEDLVDVKLDRFENGDWSISYMLFVFSQETASGEYEMVCNIKLCSKDNPSSVCKEVGSVCLKPEI